MSYTHRSFECQVDHEDSDGSAFMRKRCFTRSEPTRGEPASKIAKNVSQEQTADIPLTPDGMLRCRVKTWNDRKYADLRQFWEDRQDGGQLKPTKTGIMLNSIEWENLCDALPDLQVALSSQNTDFQVNMSQMRSATVCCDEEGPYVDVREFTWKVNSHRNFDRRNREPTDKGIELGKSSLRALSHAAGIISSLLPGCAEPPSPPKTARLYQPAFGDCTHHGPSDGVKHPSPGTGYSSMESPSPPMHAGNPYPENSLTYSNYGAGVRRANAMRAAHTAYEIVSPGMGGPQVGYGPSEAVQGIGKAMHDPASCHLHPSATPRGVDFGAGPVPGHPNYSVAPLQPHGQSQAMPIPPFQVLPGW